MSLTEFKIGQLAKETGCKIPTIRYYEEIGILPEPHRSAGNRRLYTPRHLKCLNFIQHCRELGFSQSAIRDLLALSEHADRPCNAVTDIARAHLDSVNRRITKLTALKTELEHLVASCSGGRIEQCHIIETLEDHSSS